MENQIRDHVEYLFQPAPQTSRTVEVREELIANLIERYQDQIQLGEPKDAAFSNVISSIGDIDELIQQLQDQEDAESAAPSAAKRKSALLVSFAVGLYIAGLAFPVFFNYFARVSGDHYARVVGNGLLLLCWAVATGLLVYNYMTRPATPSASHWSHTPISGVKLKNRRSLLHHLQATIWIATAPLYLIIGLWFDYWHPGWLIFLLAAVANQILRLLFLYTEE